MIYILSSIFGFLIPICGVSIIESPFKAVVLLVFFCASMEIVRVNTLKNKEIKS